MTGGLGNCLGRREQGVGGTGGGVLLLGKFERRWVCFFSGRHNFYCEIHITSVVGNPKVHFFSFVIDITDWPIAKKRSIFGQCENS
jgi:hypothetical protein